MALCDMIWQFGYECNKDQITTGGLSALETAFLALKIDDPCPRSELLKIWESAQKEYEIIEGMEA